MYLRGTALQWWADQIADKQSDTSEFTMAAFMALSRTLDQRTCRGKSAFDTGSTQTNQIDQRV